MVLDGRAKYVRCQHVVTCIIKLCRKLHLHLRIPALLDHGMRSVWHRHVQTHPQQRRVHKL